MGALVRLLKESEMKIPEGWKLVPIELTEEMNVAGIYAAAEMQEARGRKELDEKRRTIYRAQLAAAPTPPAPKSAELHDLEIRGIALDCGFKLKSQPDGTEDLNPYVYQFAREILATMPSVEEVAAFAQAMAKRNMPPAQEDEPVYQINVGPDKWWDVDKSAFDQITIDAPPKRILYTRPANDELRKAAEEALQMIDRSFVNMSLREKIIVRNLRAALEK
jgi:hypothetical protein